MTRIEDLGPSSECLRPVIHKALSLFSACSLIYRTMKIPSWSLIWLSLRSSFSIESFSLTPLSKCSKLPGALRLQLIIYSEWMLLDFAIAWPSYSQHGMLNLKLTTWNTLSLELVVRFLTRPGTISVLSFWFWERTFSAFWVACCYALFEGLLLTLDWFYDVLVPIYFCWSVLLMNSCRSNLYGALFTASSNLCNSLGPHLSV